MKNTIELSYSSYINLRSENFRKFYAQAREIVDYNKTVMDSFDSRMNSGSFFERLKMKLKYFMVDYEYHRNLVKTQTKDIQRLAYEEEVLKIAYARGAEKCTMPEDDFIRLIQYDYFRFEMPSRITLLA